MKKTLKDMAKYLKDIIPQEIPEKYSINPVFEKISNRENIQKGVAAFRDFLNKLYDKLIAEGDLHDKPKAETHEFMDRISIKALFPFLFHLSDILMNMGYHGKLDKNRDVLLLNNVQSNLFKANISSQKKIECLKFLTECGIQFNGMDLNEKKQDISEIETLKISYSGNPAMLTGLKVMALAQKTCSTVNNQDIFLRCDYRVIKNDITDIVLIIKDIIKPLSADLQKIIIKLHKRYLDKGLNCVLEIKSFCIRFIYSCKNKELWVLSISLNNGYQIVTRAQNAHKYADTIKNVYLRKIIEKGYGCGKKKGTTDSCDGGCRGYRISLDNSFIDLCDDVVIWLDNELACIQNK